MASVGSSSPFRGSALLKTRDVAELLGISSEAVLRRWRAGELPGFRLSTKVLRFRESELMDWLENRREGPARPHPLGSEQDAG